MHLIGGLPKALTVDFEKSLGCLYCCTSTALGQASVMTNAITEQFLEQSNSYVEIL